MSHYFTPDPSDVASRPKRFTFRIGEATYEMESDAGVFSKQGLDFGSRLLLESIVLPPRTAVLDMGCGYGPLGIVFAKRDHALATLVDINKRALVLAKDNAKRNNVAVNVLASDGFQNVEGVFDAIVTNPPIRAGKKVVYAWFEQARNHLSSGGRFCLVIRKDQGAPSAQKELLSLYGSVEIVAKKSGYFVFSCTKD
jgi:16S rRNA (guanine1207-N2)-methyltransferase